ncbi:MAG: SUMF1/EgtB/PvdO family nonheme iron enzyme, partial [Deltaproteobacteria bacterium]|nr:SUMF1/EgtB/PvdO family nonheme iron enzyme [Deltaproteobacteria bacterium]
SASNSELVICVSDTGVGIPKKNIPKLFDPFFTTKPAGQGTGLKDLAVHTHQKGKPAEITDVATKPGMRWKDGEIFDLAGLVWEWTADWFANYSPEDQHNPLGPDNGSSKVLRGGCYCSESKDLRASAREPFFPVHHSQHVGFRVARRLA